MATRSSRKTAKRTSERHVPKNQVVVRDHGRIIAHGGVTMGDKIVHGNEYNVAGSMNVANVSTPREFVEQLRHVENGIAVLKSSGELLPAQVRRIDVVEGDVREVIEEAQKPKPLPARISATLTEAKEMMDKIGGSVTSAMELGAALGLLAEAALKIFGH